VLLRPGALLAAVMAAPGLALVVAAGCHPNTVLSREPAGNARMADRR